MANYISVEWRFFCKILFYINEKNKTKKKQSAEYKFEFVDIYKVINYLLFWNNVKDLGYILTLDEIADKMALQL